MSVHARKTVLIILSWMLSLTMAMISTGHTDGVEEAGEKELTYTVLSRQTDEKPGGAETRIKIRVESLEKPADARLEALAKRVAREEGHGEVRMTLFFYSPPMNFRSGGFAVAEFSSGEMDQFNIPCGCVQW